MNTLKSMITTNQTELTTIVQNALNEDIGDEDITSQLISAETHSTAHFIAKADGVVAGLAAARLTFMLVDDRIQFTELIADGTSVSKGDLIAIVSGPARSILTAERTALNIMQRMSGIASLTRQFVDAVAHTHAVILDTRKTAPGLRLLDKWAVRLGGGENHRMGLYDMVLIKENHIAAAGGITQAVESIRTYLGIRPIPIEVEVTNLDELREALQLNIDRIMLDNMSLAAMRDAVAITNGQTKLEASGNVNLSTVAAIAETGVDYISSGALTHSVIALDISLLAQ